MNEKLREIQNTNFMPWFYELQSSAKWQRHQFTKDEKIWNKDWFLLLIEDKINNWVLNLSQQDGKSFMKDYHGN